MNKLLLLFNICVFFSLFHIGCSKSCSFPLLNTKYNIWAPSEDVLLGNSSQFSNLNLCNYLINQQSCCNNTTFDYYSEVWNIFKDYFSDENKKILRILSSKIENAYYNRENIIDIYKSMNSTLTSLYSRLDEVRNEDITINLTSNSNDSINIDLNEIIKNINSYLNLGINDYNFSVIKINDYIDWSTNISDFLLNNTSGYYQEDYLRYLDTMSENDLNQEINNTQTRYLQFIDERTKCFSSIFKHFASLMCLSCEPDYGANGFFLQNNTLFLNLSLETCFSFQNDCFNYLEKAVEMNKNALFFANIDTLNETANSQLNETFSSLLNVYNFINEKQTSLNKFLQEQILYFMPNECSKGNCSYICESFLTSTGLNFEKILNGTQFSPDSLDFSGNINNIASGLNRRILQEIEINSSTINFISSFPTNTYEKASLTQLNCSIDGSAGIVLFEKKEQVIENIFINHAEKINGAFFFNFLLIYCLFHFIAK